MWSGTVVRHGGRAMRAQAAQVTGDPLAAVEDLDGSGGDACLNLLTQQRMRHAVPVLGDLDVIVEADTAPLPVGVFVGGWWQRQQGGPVELLVQGSPGGPPAAHRPIIDLVD